MATGWGEKRMKEILSAMYRIQMYHFFPEEVMPQLMKECNLSEEEAIQLVRAFINRGWLNTSGLLPRYFLRPGYISCFPVIISAAGLNYLKEKSF
ncbi:hypothetical protein GFC01_01485 [Desulfofundulus thermobenzoicus]|uniref:Uncharacterized protein n=1 Tax=Desulfofundulus thermobenzoicus TaxID=29376 RepID=A0A6N7IMT2_9FIRM|nr:hypothetical protein [Desulfofundulus thermobenzoicus]MQL50963.1 hypothetical protein [Desulfofundulus thermobenzoicus]HHW42867.1 hypothetical protein [Desulfotomaculum sp.]